MVFMDGVIKEIKMVRGRMEVNFLEEERDWRLLVFLYAHDLVLCGELGEDSRLMIGCFVEIFKRRYLQVNEDRIKVMML